MTQTLSDSLILFCLATEATYLQQFQYIWAEIDMRNSELWPDFASISMTSFWAKISLRSLKTYGEKKDFSPCSS